MDGWMDGKEFRSINLLNSANCPHRAQGQTIPTLESEKELEKAQMKNISSKTKCFVSSNKKVLLVAPIAPKWMQQLKEMIYPIDLNWISHFTANCISNSGITLVLAVGGDGILSACVNALSAVPPTRVIIYNVPLGTSNDFHFGMLNGRSFHLQSLAEMINASKWKTFRVNVSCFQFPNFSASSCSSSFSRTMINIGSAGISSQLKPLKWLGRFGYVVAGAIQAWKKPSFHLKAKINGEWKTFPKTALVAICNGKCFGGRIFIAPCQTADTFDSALIVVVVVKFISLWNLFWLFVKMIAFPRFKFHHSQVEYFKTCQKVYLESPYETIPVEIDGDVVASLPCCVVPNAFYVEYLRDANE